MLLLKILGSIMIIISCSLIGYFYGTRYSKRQRNLIVFQNCISLLETEIIYSATPIPEALESVYKKGNKNVSFVFRDIKDYLLSDKNHSVFDSFVYVTECLKDKLYFKDEDVEIFLSLGRVIGSSDRYDQQKYFKLIHTQLKNQQIEADEARKKNEKMYKSLGVMMGLAITIILL